MNSGFMSKGTKKRSIRKGGKRSISLAVQNETLINKIQEQLAEFKAHVATEFTRVDKSVLNQGLTVDTKMTDLEENLARNATAGIKE